MKPFKDLTTEENEKLLKFPAYISLLAANGDSTMDETEKRSAVQFAHIKTFSADPLLKEFYREADKVLEKNIQQLDKELPSDRKQRAATIKQELSKLEKIIQKLGENYTSVMHRSMQSFKDHVSKAHHNVLVDFIFPVPLDGIND